MPLTLDLLRHLQSDPPSTAWAAIAEYAVAVFRDQVDGPNPVRDIVRRESLMGDVDLFLATAGWDLWESFGDEMVRTSDALVQSWGRQDTGRAILVLDGLSLRELPWLLKGIQEGGYTIHDQLITAAELPPNTNTFAKALGLSSRSSMYNNSAGSSHKLPGARTDLLDCAWEDAAAQVTADPSWFLWHTWPDSQLHALSQQGKGIQELILDVRNQLTSDGFWTLVNKLSQGRRLIITGDHGYAATGLFPDINDIDQTKHMKEHFKAGRSVQGYGPPTHWVPPIELALESPHGLNRYIVGRRKWKATGGYPTLANGGLTVLEVLVPFLEVSREDS